MSVSVCQATYTEPLLAGRSQTLWIEPEPIIIKAPSPKPMVFAAPPLPQTNDFSCGPLPTSSVGKKLQVSPEPLNSTIAQASYVESPIVAYETNVVQCRVPEMLGKKLQVAPAPLISETSQALYIEKLPIPFVISRSQSIWEEPHPAPHARMTVQTIYSESSLPIYESGSVQCRAVEMLGKKLQVMPKPLTVSASQTSYVEPVPATLGVTRVQSMYEEMVISVERAQVFWEDPEQIIIKPQTPRTVVMAVPTQSTTDFSCDPPLLDTASKELQVSTEPLSRAVVNITPKLIPMVVSRGQTAYVDEVMPTYSSSAVQCTSIETTNRKLQVTPQPLSLKMSRSSVILVESKEAITTHGKKLQVAPEPMATAIMQSPDAQFATRSRQTVSMEKPLSTYSSCGVQCRPVQTLGKKLQVLPELPSRISIQSVVEEPERVVYETTHVQAKPAETIGKKLQVQPPPLLSTTAQTAWVYRASSDATSGTDAISTAHASIEPIMIEKFGKKLQVSPELMSIAVIQSGQSETIPRTRRLTIGRAYTIKEIAHIDHKGTQFVSEGVLTSIQPVEVQKFNKKLQVQPLALSSIPAQTLWEEPIVIRPLPSEGIVMTAPPIETYDMGCDPLPSMEKINKKLMVRPPLMETTHVQSTVEAAERALLSTQEVQADIPLTTPIIKPTSPVQRDYEAPPIVRETYETGTQHEINMRNVRIQKYFDAFEGTANVGIQFSPPAIRRSPPITRVRTADSGVQFNPTTMIGITQTLPIERAPSPTRPSIFTESTQTEVQKGDANLFSFIRETKTKVLKERRARSQGLISYKTQVPSQLRDHAVSVPSMLHVMESGAEQYSYQQQRTTSTHVPKRYGRGGTYDRRLRSLETMYEDGRIRGLQGRLPRHSESDLYRENVYMGEILRTQQQQLEETSMDHLQRIVRSIGMERVQSMLRRIWEEEEEEHAIYEEIYGRMYTPRPLPALRYEDVGTQYAIPAYGIVYATDFGVQAGNSHVQWIPLASGQTVQIESEESTDYDEAYEWDPYQSAWRPRMNSFQWVARTGFDFATLTEVTEEEENQFIDRLLRSPALSAYTSDFEMQQAGIKLNYPESGTVSVVSWKPQYMDGEDQLDVDTIGRLLRVSLVGARVPGTGEVISAADAFYRGILRVVYVDDSRGNIMPLPTAIVANAVIVEKQYLRGVGIALHSTSLRFPVECQEMWRTPTLRRRTYRVNYIQKSPNERVDLSKALDEGLIDLTSGELVKITPVTSEAQLEPRESTLEAGEPIAESSQPERYSVHEAILNDILNVELLAPETVIFPSTEVPQEGVIHAGETSTKSPGPEEEGSDMEV
ncbi:unnamed protein product [Rodentolepis nana]|uniref:Uncharacterized protein n=1 Tax=Rodentolepis nana TaxID=102285 RepID=A0A3P7RYF3_RODNA|nr:unnamed protein product [Rodentolepis nana]